MEALDALMPMVDNGVWQQLAWRLPAAWAVPILESLTGHGSDAFVIMLSVMGSVVLVWRRSGKGKVARSPMPCHVYVGLLSIIILIQLCCLGARSFHDSDTVYVNAPGAKKHVADVGNFSIDAAPNDLKWHPRTISVILPCAQEPFVRQTIEAIFLSIPKHMLKEIVLVDDGSDPPLSRYWTPGRCREWRVKLIRHEKTIGLIGSKKAGGDKATGDILVFFDCHVAPQQYWYSDFFELMKDNYRRMVVPQITHLDVDKWQESRGRPALSKCYLTFDADFKWYDNDDMFVAVISGGLVGISRLWWMQTGGLDTKMFGWGGENLDQSLRCWLCGGEIVVSKNSRVAHMWRTGFDERTAAKYKHVGDTKKNRARAIAGWYGEFKDKLAHYPLFAKHRTAAWIGDLKNYQDVKDRLNGCRPFAWFLRRFKDLYEDGGLVPEEVFMIQESSSGRCLRYQRQAGTSPNGKGTAMLEECDRKDHAFYWHRANRDRRKRGKCCSSFKAWNTDQCITGVAAGALTTEVCNVMGKDKSQDWDIIDGRLQGSGLIDRRPRCVGPELKDGWHHQVGEVVERGCNAGDFHTKFTWTTINPVMPLEAQLYRKAQREYPAMFGPLGVQKKALYVPPMPQACLNPADQNATCVQIYMKDGTGRCLDEAGLFTSASKYCSQYQLLGMCPTCDHEGKVAGIKGVVTGRCFDSMHDHDKDTWDLEVCEGSLWQTFSRNGSTLCLIDTSSSAGGRCFDFKVVGKVNTAKIIT